MNALKLIMEALEDAANWQDSIADAHTLPEWHMNKKMKAVADKALKKAALYRRTKRDVIELEKSGFGKEKK